jgi:hypothetical protein
MYAEDRCRHGERHQRCGLWVDDQHTKVLGDFDASKNLKKRWDGAVTPHPITHPFILWSMANRLGSLHTYPTVRKAKNRR